MEKMLNATSLGETQLLKINVKIPHQKRALVMLESSDIQVRMMGYALLTTCFHLCSSETKKYVYKKWKQEEVCKKFKKAFIDYCEKIFAR